MFSRHGLGTCHILSQILTTTHMLYLFYIEGWIVTQVQAEDPGSEPTSNSLFFLSNLKLAL